MNQLNKRKEHIIRFEFWAVTTLYAFFLFFGIIDRLLGDGNESAKYQPLFAKAGLSFNYIVDVFLPTLLDFISLYAGYWLINFYLVPKILERKSIIKHLFFIGLVFIGIAAIDMGSDRLRFAYLFVNNSDVSSTTEKLVKDVIMETFQFGVLMGIYTMLKYTALYFIANRIENEGKFRSAKRNGTDALVLWLMSMFILFIAEADAGVLVGWGLIGPVSILLYMYASNTLLPASFRRRRRLLHYILRVLVVLIIIVFPLFLFSVLTLSDPEAAASITLLNLIIQLFLTAPLTWVLYKRQLKSKEAIMVLEKELTQSTANLDFLRSQINPHFLFNALNNIYGMAIMEKAERTSEGIERLSDMMRFMLQENVQEKIALTREIAYLNNYIGLQRLRTDAIAGVKIETEIQDVSTDLHVAPMLLIPFVENAFKHGISFRESSFITVKLEVKEKRLYFEVINSMHKRSSNDPEKYNSGIGLENVKQRLHLLYPDKHVLAIRQTDSEYFVHLRLDLI